MKSKLPCVTHVSHSEGKSFYADFGFDAETAQQIEQFATRWRKVQDESKATLAGSIQAWITKNRLKQGEAAKILGISRPRVSDLVNMKVEKFSIDMLMTCAVRAGQSVQVIVS